MRIIIPAVIATVVVAAPVNAQDMAVRSLIDRFEAARVNFDPGALAMTLAPDYEEISPIGDVDTRSQVIGFYAPQARRDVPPMSSDGYTMHVQGDVAIATVRRSIAMANGATRSMRVRYVARRTGRQWLLTSAQFTPIPAPKPR